jgi:hypothetical protein
MQNPARDIPFQDYQGVYIVVCKHMDLTVFILFLGTFFLISMPAVINSVSTPTIGEDVA